MLKHSNLGFAVTRSQINVILKSKDILNSKLKVSKTVDTPVVILVYLCFDVYVFTTSKLKRKRNIDRTKLLDE